MATAVIDIERDYKRAQLFFEIEKGRVTEILRIEIEDNYRQLVYSPQGTLLSISIKNSVWTSTSMKEEMLKEWSTFAQTELESFKKEHLNE